MQVCSSFQGHVWQASENVLGMFIMSPVISSSRCSLVGLMEQFDSCQGSKHLYLLSVAGKNLDKKHFRATWFGSVCCDK